MSQIATALAKAKERPGTQAPFVVPGSALRTQPAIKRTIPANLVWGVLLGITVLSAALLFWLKRNAASVTPAPDQLSAAAAIPGNTIAASAGSPVAPLAGAGPTNLIIRNETAVKQLNISAVMPGDTPRIVIGGKVFYIGDTVAAPDVSFAGIEAGQLVFADASGNRYTRRF